MSDIAAQKPPVWRPPGSVVAADVNPSDSTQIIMVWSTGYLTAFGKPPMPVANPPVILKSGESVVDIQVINWGVPSGYMLTNRARLLSFGGASLTTAGLKGLTKITGGKAVAFAMDPAGNGTGYWINAHGEIARFGNVPAITTTNVEKWVTRFQAPTCIGWSFDWETKRYIIASTQGQLIRSPLATQVPVAVEAKAAQTLTKSKYARGFTYNWAKGAGYLIDGHGGLYVVGNATALPNDPYWPNHDVARRIIVQSWGDTDTFRYAIVDSAGAVHPRTRTTPPVVRISEPLGTFSNWTLATPDAPGTFRLGFGSDMSKAIPYRATRAQLTAALDDLLGASNYTLTDLPDDIYDNTRVLIEYRIGGVSNDLEVRTGMGTSTTAGAFIFDPFIGGEAEITDTTRPTVSWDYTDAESDQQGRFEVQVWQILYGDFALPEPPTAAIPGVFKQVWKVSGTGESVRTVRIEPRLENDGVYRVYVRAQERNGVWSNWAHADFRLDLDVPVNPVGTVAAAPERAAVQLELDGITDPKSLLWWERRRLDSDEWEIVRSSGLSVRHAVWSDTFDRPDASDLGDDWLAQDDIYAPLAIRSGQAVAIRPLDASRTRFFLAGNNPALTAAPGSIGGYLETPGRRVVTWEPPPTALVAQGGIVYEDSFDRVQNPIGPAYWGGTPWLQLSGTWRADGSKAGPTAHGSTIRDIIAIETARTEAFVVAKFLGLMRGPEIDAALHRFGVALGVDAAGGGYYLGVRVIDADNIRVSLWHRTGAVDTVLDYRDFAVGVFGDGEWHTVQMTADMRDGEIDVHLSVDGGASFSGGDPFDYTLGDVDGTLYGPWLRNDVPLGTVWVTDFAWYDANWRPGDADGMEGFWLSDSGHVTSKTAPARLDFEVEADTAMSVTLAGPFTTGSSLVVRHDGADDGLLLVGGADDAELRDLDSNALLGTLATLGSASAAGDVLTIQVCGPWVMVLLNGIPRAVRSNPIADSTASGAEWTTADAAETIDSGHLVLTASGAAPRTETSANHAVVPGQSVAAAFFVEADDNRRAVAYARYYDGASTSIGVRLGPTVDLVIDTPGVAFVEGVVPEGAAYVRYGIVFPGASGGDVFTISDITPSTVIAAHLPDALLHGTRHGLASGTFGSVRFESVFAINPGLGAIGVARVPPNTSENVLLPSPSLPRAQSLRQVPELAETDGVLLSWPVDDTGVEGTQDYIDSLDAAIAWLRCEWRRTIAPAGGFAAIDTSVLTGDPVVASYAERAFSTSAVIGDDGAVIDLGPIPVNRGSDPVRVYVGVVVRPGDAVTLSYRHDDGTGPWSALIEALAPGGALSGGHLSDGAGGVKVFAVDLPSGWDPDKTFQVRAESDDTILDWWGIEHYANKAPQIALVDYVDGVDDFSDMSAMHTVVESHWPTRVQRAGATVGDYEANNLIGGMYRIALEALDPNIDQDGFGAAYRRSNYPAIRAKLGIGAALAVGMEEGSINSIGLYRQLIESEVTPGQLAIQTGRFDGLAAPPVVLGTVELPGTTLNDEVEVKLDWYTYLPDEEPTGDYVAIGGAIGATIDDVFIGEDDRPFYDYEAVPGVRYQYRLRASTPDGEVFAEPVIVGTVNAPQVGYWLKDPLDPRRNRRVIRTDDDFEVSRTEEQGVFDPPGRPTAIVVSGVVKAERLGAMTLAVKGSEALDDLLTMLNSGRVLLFQSARRRQWYVRFGPEVTHKSIMDFVIEGEELFELSLPEASTVDAP